MSKKVRVGIVGTSSWTDMMFLASFKSDPSAEMSAICGRNRDRAEEMAAKYGIPSVFTEYRALLEQNMLDAVVVATPDDLHYPMTMEALDAGLHVLCEKPLALNAQHARVMVEKAEAAGVKHMVLFTWRWQPHFRYLKQLVDDGYIGRCYHAQFHFIGGFGRQPKYRWRSDNQRSNGILGDLGAHMIDFAHWYIGDVRKVSAHLTSFVNNPGVDGRPSVPANDSALVTLQFENEAQAIVQASAVAHQADRVARINVRLHGDAGTLEAEHKFFGAEAGVVIRGARHDEEQFSRLPVPADFTENLSGGDIFEPYQKQVVGPRLFINAILEDRPVSPSFYDGLKVQAVIDAAIEADRNACWVSI